jgi:hypothetical protein
MKAGAKESRHALRTNFDPRPPYRACGDWDRMVRVIRARDRLRGRGYAPGPVDDAGKQAVIRALDDSSVMEIV